MRMLFEPSRGCSARRCPLRAGYYHILPMYSERGDTVGYNAVSKDAMIDDVLAALVWLDKTPAACIHTLSGERKWRHQCWGRRRLRLLHVQKKAGIGSRPIVLLSRIPHLQASPSNDF
jgi:hypothetical protein